MPALDLTAFRQQIQKRALGPLYVLVGEDVKLVERMVDAVEATIDEADRPFAVERLYAAESGGWPIDIAAAARVFPMLGDRRIVIVLRAERLLKPKRASRAADVEETDAAESADEDTAIDLAPLEEYVAAPVPSTTVVFVAAEVDRARRLTKRLMEKASVVVFGGIASPTPAMRRDARAIAMDLVRDELTQAGRTMDAAAMALLVDRAGGEVTKLRGDLERVLLYTEGQTRISREDVMEIASADTAPEDDWAVVNAIADQDAARALKEAARRLDHGESAHMLIGQIRWWVSNRLVQIAPARVRPAIDALLRDRKSVV